MLGHGRRGNTGLRWEQELFDIGEPVLVRPGLGSSANTVCCPE